MNCCDRLLVLFLAFAFIQFSFRWESDAEISRAPWQIYAMGKSQRCHLSTSSTITFHRQAIAYGTPTSKITNESIISTDRQEVFIVLYANITAPPMSSHRIQLMAGGKPVRQMSVFVGGKQKAYSSMYISLIHLPSFPIEVKYVYDDIWSVEGIGQADVHMVIRSGYASLWDVTWSDVYI